MKNLFFKVSAVMLAVLMCFSVLLPENIPKVKAATETAATLTNHGTQWYNESGCGKFTVGSVTAICCEHAKSQPPSGTVYRSVIENAELAKNVFRGIFEQFCYEFITNRQCQNKQKSAESRTPKICNFFI